MAPSQGTYAMTTHEIEAGDWLGALADAYGFAHWSSIWDSAVNASLRELRPSPDLLMVGDELHIPEGDVARGVEVMTGCRAVFVLRGADMLRLRICGLASFIDAFGAVAFKLEAGGRILEGELEREGQELCVPLEASAKSAKLTLWGEVVHEFAIGGLGPASEGKGAHTRLVNLGFRDDFAPGGETGEKQEGSDHDAVKTSDPCVSSHAGARKNGGAGRIYDCENSNDLRGMTGPRRRLRQVPCELIVAAPRPPQRVVSSPGASWASSASSKGASSSLSSASSPSA